MSKLREELSNWQQNQDKLRELLVVIYDLRPSEARTLAERLGDFAKYLSEERISKDQIIDIIDGFDDVNK